MVMIVMVIVIVIIQIVIMIIYMVMMMVKLWLLHRLGAGTTRMCAGIVSVAKAISIESQMADYSNSLYQQLEEETGVNTGTLL